MAENTEKSVYDVSRVAFDVEKAKQVAESLGISSEPTSLELKVEKNGKKEVVKTVNFTKIRFETPAGDEDQSEDRLARAVQYFETLQPTEYDKENNIVRVNNPLDVILSHVSYSLDLTMRNAIRAKEAAVLEGPDKEMLKQAKKLAAFKGITEAEALEKVKLAWGIE